MGRSRKLLDSAGVSYKRFQPNNIRPSPVIITHRRRTLASHMPAKQAFDSRFRRFSRPQSRLCRVFSPDAKSAHFLRSSTSTTVQTCI